MRPMPKTNVVLSRAAWKKLVEECFDRDGECKLCGSGAKDTFCPHHLIPVSRGRVDTLGNLITLCYACHLRLHGGELSVTVDDLIDRYNHPSNGA